MKTLNKFVLVLICGLCFNGFVRAQSENDAAAVVNGKKITQREVDDSIIGQLAPLREQISLLRKAALENFILKTILEQEASRRSLTVGDFKKLLTRTEVAIPQSQVEREYLANSAAFGQMSPDEAKERIRLDLETHARMRFFRAELEKLRSRAQVDVLVQYVKDERFVVDTGGPAIGSDHPKVVIVMFSDFQCPFCRQSVGVIRRVLEKYGAETRLIYKSLPLDIHSEAFPAARAAVCAHQQGRFWQYHDALFTSADLTENGLFQLAEKLELDMSGFKNCQNSEFSRLAVVRDLQEAKRLKVEGTPTFFINGIPVIGAVTFEKISQRIDEEIKLRK